MSTNHRKERPPHLQGMPMQNPPANPSSAPSNRGGNSSENAGGGGGGRLDAVSKALFAPFTHKKGDSSRILADLAPVIMTPRMASTLAQSKSPPSAARASLGLSHPSSAVSFATHTLGRMSLRGSVGRRITSTELSVLEDADALLGIDIPDSPVTQPRPLNQKRINGRVEEEDEIPEAKNISLLRGFEATIPSAERGKTRRRMMRSVDGPRVGLKRLGAGARGLLVESSNDDESRSVASASEDDIVLIKPSGKGKKSRKRRGRESLGATVRLGRAELERQVEEIKRDKENVYVKRALIHNEISEVTHKITALENLRGQLEQDLLKLQEDELELDDELEGVRERMEYEEAAQVQQRTATNSRISSTSSSPAIAPTQLPNQLNQNLNVQSSRRRKGPVFLPSEHSELPPGVAFMTLQQPGPINALDFSEPYGTLVTAFSPPEGGNSFEHADTDSSPIVWDLLTASELGRLRGHRGPVKVVQVEGDVCVTGGEDGCVRVWDLRAVGDDDDLDLMEGEGGEDGDEEGVRVSLDEIPEEGEDDDGEVINHPQSNSDPYARPSVYARAPSYVSPSVAPIATPASTSLSSSTANTSSSHLRSLLGHTRPITALYFEESCLVTGAEDKTIRQWDLRTGQCVMTMDILWALTHPDPSSSTVGNGMTGSTMTGVGLGGGISTGFPSSSMGPSAVNGNAGSSIYGSSFGHRVKEDPFSSILAPSPYYSQTGGDDYDFVGGVQFWGYALVSGSGDGAVRMWDMRTGQSHRTLLGHTAPVTCLQFDELHIVSGSLDRTIKIWDLRTGGIFETITYDHGVTALQFDSRKIVAATGENGVKIYNRTSSQQSTLMINGHTNSVERLRYMDKYLVSGGRDATVKIWAL